MIIARARHRAILERLQEVPAVVLLGPRQVGKTTLALKIADGRDAVYLDLESATDRARLVDVRHFLDTHMDRLVVLDEVHRVPELFQELRGSIDRGRRAGREVGRFLLLGSASMDLMRQSESLAGRVSYLELEPVGALEVLSTSEDELWVRGGFPRSLLARSDRTSLRWRRDLIRTYLEREVPMFAPRIPSESLRRLWTMLAHTQGGMLNSSLLARALGVSPKTAAAYVDLLVDLLLVRRLPAWSGNVGKRLVRSPKLFVRDSGLVHALLGLGDLDSVLTHPIAGPSWEGWVLENLITLLPDDATPYFYRTAHGAEIDLFVEHPAGERWAFEIKRSVHAVPRRGMYVACEDLKPTRTWIVTPGDDVYEERPGIVVSGVRPLLAQLARTTASG